MYKTFRVLLCSILILAAVFQINPTPIAKADVAPPVDPILVRQEVKAPPLTEEEIINQYIHDICLEQGVDERLIKSVVRMESNYNPDALGDHGRSVGLMQIQPRWHKQRAADLGITDLRDPYGNLVVGIDYLSDLLDLYSPELALMVYNGGPTYASKMHSRGMVSRYAREVIGAAQNTK